MQNASVNELFKKICPLTITFRTSLWETGPVNHRVKENKQ